LENCTALWTAQKKLIIAIITYKKESTFFTKELSHLVSLFY